MALDPAIRRMLDAINARPRPTDAPIEEQRAAWNAMQLILREGSSPVTGVETVDGTIPGRGGDIPVRVYRPEGLTAPAPLIVYLHGGSWIFGGIESHDPATRLIARTARAVVVSVDYRLAPEHPFPAGLEDAQDALRWAFENAASVGGDPTKVVVGGDSAGGNFSIALSVWCRDEGLPLAAQLLIYPSSDLSKRYPAMDELASGYLLETPPVEFPDRAYLVEPELRFDPRVSPILTESFAGVAPAVVFSAAFDPIKEHADVIVAAYRDAGVPVIAHEAPDLIHGYVQAPGSPAAVAELESACAALGVLL